MKKRKACLIFSLLLSFNIADISVVYAKDYTTNELKELATQAAKRYDMDVSLIFAIIQQESAWNPDAISHADAIGLMQIIPSTGKASCDLSEKELFDPEKNLDCGTQYFSQQLKEFKSIKLALCAYNAGPHRAKKGLEYCKKIRETKNYISRILNIWNEGKQYDLRPHFPDSAKRIANSWHKKRDYKGGYKVWWRLVCESIDVVYDRKMAKLDPKAVGKSVKASSKFPISKKRKIWSNILVETADDIRLDELETKKQPRSLKTIKDNIKNACPKKPRKVQRQVLKKSPQQFLMPANQLTFSAKAMADNWFITGNYERTQWWGLVCQAIDEVYDKETETIGESAITSSQQRIWLKILEATVDDISSDLKRLQQGKNWSKDKIKGLIKKGCPKGRS
ncbi:transglycosylase SLT domain-containing protein [Candidatus Parabeggiatoa sp. HSG14]|uniref:lytic transglycosylase domain-containing protein n=1 Tax=Candidatus Parabeggiatoa sp. HSG14 TaxID=3055593 RepID=UPI0025A6C71E|nr:transglycosylase SLT domain-containing protein [Thiotrichales bacterium HSG14]